MLPLAALPTESDTDINTAVHLFHVTSHFTVGELLLETEHAETLMNGHILLFHVERGVVLVPRSALRCSALSRTMNQEKLRAPPPPMGPRIRL